jgi:hypothetical protein
VYAAAVGVRDALEAQKGMARYLLTDDANPSAAPYESAIHHYEFVRL